MYSKPPVCLSLNTFVVSGWYRCLSTSESIELRGKCLNLTGISYYNVILDVWYTYMGVDVAIVFTFLHLFEQNKKTWTTVLKNDFYFFAVTNWLQV